MDNGKAVNILILQRSSLNIQLRPCAIAFELGDHLLKALRKVIDWPAPHETTQVLRYPENGNGSMITRVELNAETVNFEIAKFDRKS